MTFQLPNKPFCTPVLRWFLQFWAKHYQLDSENFLILEPEAPPTYPQIPILTLPPLAFKFYAAVEIGIFDHTIHFKNEPRILTETGETDYIATIFYHVNCLQEHTIPVEKLDKYGRFRYVDSHQARFGTITRPIVNDFLNEFTEKLLELNPILRGGILSKKQPRPSKIFLTHDIDTLYSSFHQDGIWAIQNGRFDVVLQLIINELLRKPAFFNIDKMLKIHDAHDLKSTFFWIAEQGRSADGIKNADYNINNRRVQKALHQIIKKGSDIGLHKSSMPTGFDAEFSKIPATIRANRYHFLRQQLPKSWETMSDSGVVLDVSLGFAEHYGFRNGYGLPFQPYDFRTQKAMPLTVTPLNVMDGTLSDYQKMPPSVWADTIIDFFENNRFDCLLCLLWHNTEFSEFKYQPFLTTYKKVLAYIVESKMPTVTAREILQ